MPVKRRQTAKKTQAGRRMQAMVTRSEAEHWLRDLVASKLAFDEQWSAICKLIGGATESPFGTAAWKPLELLIDCVADLIGDEIGAVNWFIWDNEAGAKRHEHSLPDGSMREVETIHDLLDVIGY